MRERLRSLSNAVDTLQNIRDEIERLSERRRELWQRLSDGRDETTAAELKELDDQIAALWDEHRALRARLRFGDRSRIVARARMEERLERAA
jgi:flagellar biosynthesis chaperone FliJ